VAGLAGNDTLTVDYSNGNPTPAGGIHFNGGGQAGDNLVIVGNGNSHGVYRPDSAVTGAGTVTVDGDVISFENLQPITVNGFFEFTVETPNSVDALTVDSPAAGQNRVNGTSGNITIENVTFFDIVHFEIDTATNDGPLPTTGSDTLDFSNLVATGLLSMTVLTGNGNDTVNAGAVLTVPLTIDGGDGDDLLTGGDGSDRVYGGAGNDRLTGSAGFDILDGGTGTDSLNWAQGDGDDDLVGATSTADGTDPDR
jgi:Ca2+-binding RTX toxin-like protein